MGVRCRHVELGEQIQVTSSRPVRVVLCADDYAMTPGVSRGILDLARAGRISATSAMAASPHWPRLAQDLIAADVKIGLGLHLTLTWGRPLGPMPSLAPDGRLPPLKTLVWQSLLGRLAPAEIAAEIGRQLDAFERAAGRSPDFVDGHQHVHTLPVIRAALIETLRRRGFSSRTWLRDPGERLAAILQRGAARKALVVSALSAGFDIDAIKAGFATNAGFSGFSDFDAAADEERNFARYLTALGPRPLVMCHPGYVDGPDGLDDLVEARARELDYLRSARFAALLAERRIQLVPAPV